MLSSRWQKQHIYFWPAIWIASAVIAMLLMTLILSLGYSIEVTGVFFILFFVILRVSLAYLFKNRFANSMVRILKFDYEALERDFRILFKEKNIVFYREMEDENYTYEFPGRHLTMKVEPYWLSFERKRAVTKITLYPLNSKTEEFAERLAAAIDRMAAQRLKQVKTGPDGGVFA